MSGAASPRLGDLPAPPLCHPFRGRERELTSLLRQLERAPVVAIVGPPDVGKSALAARVATSWATALSRPVRWLATPGRGVVGAVAALLPEAEERGAIVILDGLEGTSPGRDEALEALARGARASRWLVTARALPPGPPSQLALAALNGDDARALAAALGVDEAAVSWIVEASLGAPGRLRRLAHAEATPPPALPATAARELAQLAALPAPASPASLGADAARALAPLVDGGLVARSAAGLSLAPTVRAEVRERIAALGDGEKRALAARLEATGDDAARINAIALWLGLGEGARAEALLDAHGEALLDSPQIGWLWELLDPVTSPRLERWRFRVAVAAGMVAAVDLGPTPDEDLELRCDHARLLLLRGEQALARAAADALLAEPGARARASLAFRAAMVSASASLNLREAEPAVAALEDIAATNEREQVSLTAVRAKALAVAGREAEGVAALEAARPLVMARFETLPRTARARFIGACVDLDQRALARHLLPDPAIAAHDAFGPDVTVLVDVAHACLLALDDGRLDDVAPFAELLPTSPPADSLVSDHAWLIRAEWLAAMGRFAAARQVVTRVGTVDRVDNAEWIAMLEVQSDMAQGVAPRQAPRPLAGAEVASTEDIARLRYALRWGGGPIATLPSRTRVKPRTRRCLPLTLRAEHGLMFGALDAAAYDAQRACDEAERHGYRMLLADALLTQADVACVRGDRRGLRAAAEALVATGRAVGSPRWEREGALPLAAQARDWATLERLAEAAEPAPVAARRARALLGDDAALDRLDDRVVAAIRSGEADGGEGAWPSVRVVADDPDLGPPWGIDLCAERVWIGGAWAELDPRKVTWRVLAALARVGGRATSRELLREVWAVNRYEPYKHDNRLQVSVHRLRGLLGATAAAPRLVRADDAYALAGRVRVISG